ncbi:hypothetical protein RvVAR0630_10780 [Agrobacterium vitis]|nr:hypothetical protein RvVAR0630_10780 [Agrobacterium vitis]
MAIPGKMAGGVVVQDISVFVCRISPSVLPDISPSRPDISPSRPDISPSRREIGQT